MEDKLEQLCKSMSKEEAFDILEKFKPLTQSQAMRIIMQTTGGHENPARMLEFIKEYLNKE